MRHFASILAVLAALAAAGPAHAAPRQSVKLLDCETALGQTARSAVFEGRMRSVAGAQRLLMRFSLQARRPGGGRWRGVPAPGLGRWVSSDRGVARYVYTKRVENLVAPAGYRALVSFRWLDADGRRVLSARETSPVCAQPDLRADLRALSMDIQAAADPGQASYAVLLVNHGRAVSDAFALALTVDGQPLAPQRVEALEPGERRTVTVTGPICRPGATLTVDLDLNGEVDERSEADNRLTRSCPAR